MDYVVYDIESKNQADQVDGGWDNVYAMGMSVGCAWWSKTNKYYFFGDTEDDRREMCEFLNGKLCITFNGISFDSKVLLGNNREIVGSITKNEKYSWDNKDIYVSMWKKILNFEGTIVELLKELEKNPVKKNVFNLDSVIQATLKTKKNSNGVEAINYYQTGQIAKLYEYVLQDVICEKDLYQFILKFGYLITGSYDIVSFVR